MDPFRILVVEDDSITRSFLSDILMHAGYEVAMAADGRAALELLGSSAPDLILSDVMMPELSGVELFRKVKEDEKLQSVPFIFLTSLDDGDAQIHLKELGPDEFIQKPVRPRHLLATVRGKLRDKERREQEVERERGRLRDQIRWSLTHELRTPLTIIQGISELLLSEGAQPSAGDAQELLQDLRSQSFQLGMLIENFLLVTRIDAGLEEESWRKGAAPCSLADAIEEAAYPYLERARSKGVQFEVEAPAPLPAVVVHRPHLLEILRQVLDNGFKFADQRAPRVTIRGSAGPGVGKVTVSDNGPGIPAADQGLIFQKLTQVNRAVQEQQGSGLGLYIAKQLTDLNRGAIAVASSPGRGTEFEISLPAAPPAA
jgi:two-component system, sensor histidine kinase and response regulator